MTSTGTEMYYQQRAGEYDKIYRKPERQSDLRVIESRLGDTFDRLDVLEIAAGTGYWTQFYAGRARSVTATDVNEAVLEVAMNRGGWPATASFRKASAFDLVEIPGCFNAAFIGFFWSHLRLDQSDALLKHLAVRLEPNSRVVMVDNRYVEGSSTPIARADVTGDTYQTRELEDGTSWEVLKNFPSRQHLVNHLEAITEDVQITELEYFWIADFRIKSP